MKTMPAVISRTIERMVSRIARRFHPERIILFGSYARGQARHDSDIDLLVVMDVHGSRRRKQIEVRTALHDIPGPVDIVVTTPQAVERRRHIPGTIERPALQEGKVLYARG